MTVDAYVNKIHASGGLGGQVSATYTLAVPQHTGQAYHHELWKHQVPVSLLVANSTTLRRAVSSAAHKFHFFARSSDFDTGVQVDSEISFLSFARKSASATSTFTPRKLGVQLAVFAELRRFPDQQRNRIFGLFRYIYSIQLYKRTH